MRAARCVAYGAPSQVVVDEVPAPQPGPGEVLVAVSAAAVNFSDVLIVANGYQVAAPLPFTPGSEFAGVVTAVGPEIDRVRPGDHVSGSVFVGAFAEQVVAAESALSLVPEGFDLHEAAAFGVAYGTAYHALRSVADVQPGEWVLVLGAGGGVGLAAVELATHLGGRVVAAASSADKLNVCRRRGAQALVNYETEDLKTRVRELTEGGADVIIDPVGGPYSEPAIRAGRWGARFVCVGFASGEIPRIPLNLVLLKGVSLLGFEFRGFAARSPDLMRRDGAELDSLLASHRLHPHISAVYPLEQAGSAMEVVADRRSTGKVVIDLRAGTRPLP